MSQSTGKSILEVKDLRTYFYTRDGVVRSVDGVSFSISEGETLAIVGESGCGKSVTSLSLLRLIPSPPGKIVSGSILYHGKDLLELSEDEMRGIRGDKISMIFQEPMTSLNPVLTIGRQISEVLELHRHCTKDEARTRILELLKLVNISEPDRRIDEYPHQLSGGMRQRIMIAMALACDPEILIADEPTTALDVTIQAQILNLMRELRDRTRAAIILITHDLGVVAEMAQRVVVMYAGRKVEEASVFDLFAKPLHPYTLGLLNSMPRLDDASSKRLVEIPGMVPSMKTEIVGCAFAPRCSVATERCTQESPILQDHGNGHWVSCWNPISAAGVAHE
ncbi:ABC transporter ATP-binding protein [Polynucleobacter sp. AP-Kaivos-20-H2]|uniref:ABC transporter ATP-binding protein n=1 Tax=Polynucleobacter sp. AP-Kaivos-20-H2 TaxID=2689104 RepID=UPI001C0D15E0|nr:ABC transporter ATP-binding protein [Polynucleobacter sp. AP-Kaivos-20-H2]MBU3603495.1 ABC transporter ATP-binding protein [Polynucleobacter sp. AP-Kaivos-20-H2]